MKAASISEIKKELKNLSQEQLLDLCMKLAKYKKDNKELLDYLLFEAHDESAYIRQVKLEIEEQFENLNASNVFFAKKTIRKALRSTNKYIKYSGAKQTEVELLLHFCKTMKDTGIPFHRYTVLNNLYQSQINKINKALAKLHEDLQYDFLEEVKAL